MKFIITLLITTLLLTNNVSAQFAQTTYKGHLKLTAVINDSTYSFTSNQLVTNIKRNGKEVEMQFDLSLLQFGVDSLHDSIMEMTDRVAVYKGKVREAASPEGKGIRPAAPVKITGELTIGGISKQIDFDATFEKVSQNGGNITDIFKCSFSIPVKDFRIDQYMPGIRDMIAVDIKQDLIEN